MRPRFIIRNIDAATLKVLEIAGYLCRENPVPKDVLVISGSIIQAPPPGKNPLVVVYNLARANGNGDIVLQAILHLKWQKEAMSKGLEIRVLNDKATVHITTLGVLIDNFVVPMEEFIRLAAALKNKVFTNLPKIASHLPVPAQAEGTMTIGCADYTLADFDKIMEAYNSLLTS